ncbi:O-methyltransferase [Flavihumibacter fluvii]|uniref:O-methyltransferase n=1 Tax=Flavihumibacter fluvii TaxID=2838157 RepID=UPI001BDEA3BF|nr:class I SAM-dependent methyltransferase [Flavihumibacter fluvii]ULQ53097.1 class I SAM-dependent methyltransferase [Flavihumibacter fluvii]
MSARPYTFFPLALRYLRYYLGAMNGSGHGIHSPFVYAFVRNVLMDRSSNKNFGRIEKMRQQLQKDVRMIKLTDFGAGSAKQDTKEKSIGQIARSAAKSPRLAQLLFRSVQYFNASTIVELGSSLGLTTAYLASANKNGIVYSLEGDPELAQAAAQNLAGLGLHNAHIIPGNFDNTLQPLLDKLSKADLVYIDGNHRLEPTLRYFEQALAVANEQTVIILDDIHWSGEMEAAWKAIQAHPKVTTTIDLFFLGYVFMRPEFKERQHFPIRF